MGGDDQIQVQVVRTRDQEFTDFVQDSGRYLHRTAYLLCGDAHQAEELVQATYERVYVAWSKARVGQPRAYARRVLVNLRIDGWRRRHGELLPGDDALPVGATPDHGPRVDLRDELVRALAQLSPTQRRVVVLRHLLDLPEAEVARELGMPVGTVKAAGSRGLARLRELVREGARTIDAPLPDAAAALDAGRRALARRRVRQALGAASVAVVLVVAFLSRGPLPLPVVGTVVVPAGDLVSRLLGDRMPEPEPPDLVGLPCPGSVPRPPSREAAPEAGLSGLGAFVTVGVSRARDLTCHDAVGSGPAVPAEGFGSPFAVSDGGALWRAATQETDDGVVRWVTAGDGAAGRAATLTVADRPGVPTWIEAHGDRVAWLESAESYPAVTATSVRTMVPGQEPATVATLDDQPADVAQTQDTILWTDADGELTSVRLHSAHPEGLGGASDRGAPGRPVGLGGGYTAVGASASEAVAAQLDSGGPAGRATTTLRRFDGRVTLDDDRASWDGSLEELLVHDTTGTDVLAFDHAASLRVTDVAVADGVLAWVLAAPEGGGTVYVRAASGEQTAVSVLRGQVVGLSVADGAVAWSVVTGVTSQAYLCRFGAWSPDEPDLVRLPGQDSRVALAGTSLAWTAQAGGRTWLLSASLPAARP